MPDGSACAPCSSNDLTDRASEELERRRQRLDLERQRALLSETLRLLRDARRLSAVAVADAMGMPKRTYYSFEAGKGPFSFARIWRFADAVDTDPMGIILAMVMNSPQVALRFMENKGASIWVGSFKRFDDKVGDRMTNIISSVLIEAFRRPFDSLEDHLEKRDQSTERWLAENLPKILREDD